MVEQMLRNTNHVSVAALISIGAFAAAAPVASAQHAADIDAVRSAEDARISSFANAAQSVVCIFPGRDRQNGGSGVLLDADGYGLTNFHVVAEFLESGGFGGLADGRLYPLQVLGIDPGGDLAMFKLSGREAFQPAPLGDSDRLHVGQWVAAFGNPFLLAEDYSPTITLGVISGLHRYQEGQGNLLEYADCIQVSTSINPGNSGGPLFDLSGRVLGINGRGSFEERGRVNVGLGYAITIKQARRFLPMLRAGKLTGHGTLGATVRAAGDELIFDAMQALSPAEKAGVQLGDTLLSIDGEAVRTPNDFNNRIAPLSADWPVRLRWRHEKEQREATVRLERLPIRLGTAFVPDARLAQTAIRRYLTLARKHIDPAAARWTLEQQPAMAVALDPANSAARLTDGASVDLDIFGVAASQPESETGDIGVDIRAADARRAFEPLLRDVPLDVDWDVVGSEPMGDRVAGVVERKLADGLRVSWRFDDLSGELLDIRVGSDPLKPRSTFRPANAKASSDESRAAEEPVSEIPPLIAAAQARVVKLTGAEVGSQKGYASGCIISSSGQIVTALSPLLEGKSLRATLADGRTLPAVVQRRDERRQLALLKIEATELPAFSLQRESAATPIGAWVWSVSNPFKVAGGNEPVSVSLGLLSGRAPLAGRFRRREIDFDRDVLLTDLIVSAPGCAGGALVDASGELIGLIGRPVTSTITNTWLNYALPVDEVAAFVRGDSLDETQPNSISLRDASRRLLSIGVRVFDVGGAQQPPFVERVRVQSLCDAAGLRGEDLILLVDDEAVATCRELYEWIARAKTPPREIVVKRGERVESIRLPEDATWP